MKREKFNLKQAESDSIQKYVNFINDHNLSDELDNFETGYKAGMFFIIAGVHARPAQGVCLQIVEEDSGVDGFDFRLG